MISGKRIREYGFIASFYSVVVGILYLWGYWSSFEVNILEYISLTDIVKVAIFPILSSFIIFALGAIAGELMLAGKFPDGGGVNTPTGRFLNKYKDWLLALYILCTYLIFLFGQTQKWLILPLLISIPISTWLRNRGFLQDLIPNGSANRTIGLLVCALPFYAFGHGIMNAHAIIDGATYQYVDLDMKKLSFIVSDPEFKDNKLKFIGVLNNLIFLMPTGGKTIIIAKFDSLEPIALKTYSRAK